MRPESAGLEILDPECGMKEGMRCDRGKNSADDSDGNKEDFDHWACFDKLKEFRRQGVVGQHICGVCVKACKGPK